MDLSSTSENRSDSSAFVLSYRGKRGHKRICDENNCKVNKLKSDINKELKIAILKKATLEYHQILALKENLNKYPIFLFFIFL